MSSATSINGTDAERLPKSATDKPSTRSASKDDPSASSGSSRALSRDDSLQPWHFFLLVSLVAATVAVVVAREARPEHLVLISLTIGAAGFAGVALYRTLSPLVSRKETEPAGVLSESMRAVLEREKMLVLRSIKELEFDRAMGKVSAKDFDEMSGRLRARAMSLMRQLDTEASYRELIERDLQARLNSGGGRARRERIAPPAPAAASDAKVAGTCACGTANDADAAFCKRCGAKLGEAGA
jgi:hypothetical protein